MASSQVIEHFLKVLNDTLYKALDSKTEARLLAMPMVTLIIATVNAV